MKKVFLIFGIILIGISSCTEKPEVGGTSAEKMANEWWVELNLGTTKDVYGIGHFKIATYNTADNNNQMWVDDLKHGWGEKVKVTADYSALTFSANKANNAYYETARPTAFPLTVNITEGKVIPNVAKSKTGNITDSIYMKIEFSDDPGTIHTMEGHARTRFSEDEY